MAKPWATPGFDLHVESTGPGLRKGLTKALREAVRSGRPAPGTRLPSSRTLGADLGIARNTVADAFADLVAERTSPGPGTAPTASPAPVKSGVRPAIWTVCLPLGCEPTDRRGLVRKVRSASAEGLQRNTRVPVLLATGGDLPGLPEC